MPETSGGPLANLTVRQRECLERAAQHWTSKDIGRHLGISPKTVDRHLEEAIRRLGVHDRLAAVRLLRGSGLMASATLVRPPSRNGGDPPGDDPHAEASPATPPSPPLHDWGRGGETFHGQTDLDVHLDRRSGRPGESGRHTATEEGGVLVAGTIEGGFGGHVAGRAVGGDRKHGAAPSGGAFGAYERTPEPVRRLGWILVIAAGLALTAGAFIGSYDLLAGFHRMAPAAAASAT